jgi:hypothetical protein
MEVHIQAEAEGQEHLLQLLEFKLITQAAEADVAETVVPVAE